MAGPLTLRTLQYRLSATDTGFKNTMQGAQSTLRSFGETARRGVTTLRNWSLAASAAGTAVALAFRKINDETAKTAAKVDDLNAKTGISRQRIQELGYAATQGNADLDTLGDGLTRMTRRTAEAAAGNEAYLASYRRLGIEILNADGTIRDTSDLFLEMAERLEQIPDVGERSRIAFNLLGDSGYALLPMLSMGREEIERYMAEAHELSAVLSDRTIAAYAAYDNTMTRFRTTMRGVRNELAAASVPIFTELAQRAEAGGRAVVAWIQENREFISQVIIMVGVLTTLALGIGLVTTGFTIAGRVIGVVSSLLGFLLSPIGLVLAGLVTLYVAWEKDWGGIQTITENVVNAIREQWDRLVEWWDESTIGQAIKAWWAEVLAVWNDEELTLPEKAIEIAKLVPGVGWVVGTVQDIVTTWNNQSLTLPEKEAALNSIIPGLGWVAGFITRVQDIWDDQTLTFSEKVVETLNLVPGVSALVGFIKGLYDIWTDETLTLPEKAIATVALTVQTVTGLVESIIAWWIGASVTLTKKAVQLLGLEPEENALVGFLTALQGIWDDETLTFGEKVVETLRITPGVSVLVDFVSGIYKIWTDEKLSLPEKVLDTVSLTVTSVVGLIESIISWWLKATITLASKVVELLGLEPEENALIGFLTKLQGIWDDETLTFGEKTIEIMGLIPGLGWLAGFLAEVRAIWNDEDLTFGEKAVAIARLIPGVAWLEKFVADVREIWNDEELTFGEKTVAIARLIPGVAWLQDFVAEVKVIWADEELTLPEKAVEIARLIPGVTAIENMIAEIKEVWVREDLTLSEKAVETFKVISDTIEVEGQELAFLLGAAITAPYILYAIGNAIRAVPGILALTSGANFLRLSIAGLTLGLAIFSWQFSNADPEARENMLAQIDEIIDGIFPDCSAVPAKAALRFAVEVGGAMFDAIKKGLDEGDWSDVWGAAADIWRAGATLYVSLQLSAQAATALLEAIRGALNLSAAGAAVGLPAVIGIMSVGVALVTAMKEGDWTRLGLNLGAALLAAGAVIGLGGSWATGVFVFTAVLNLELGGWLWDFFSQKERRDELQAQLDETTAEMMEALLEQAELRDELEQAAAEAQRKATELAIQTLEQDLAKTTDPERRRVLEDHLALLRDELELTKVTIDEADQSLASFLTHLEQMSGQSGLAAFLAALYRAEGGSEARVPFGMTDFADAGNQFGKAENRDKFRHLLSLIDVEEGTAEFYAAAAAISVEHYWNTFLERFPELADKTLADLAPDIARMFIEHMGDGFAPVDADPLNENWIPNMISILGVRDGGESVMKAWAEGLAAGGEDAKRVIEEITKWVADRTIGHSPPPEGPLSDIDDPKVGETWIQAIAREIEEEGGTLEAAIRVVADRMWNSMMGFLEARWPGAAEFLKGLMGAEWDPSDAIGDITTQVNDLKQQIKDLNNQSIQWTNNLVKGISDAIAYGRDLSSVFQNFLSMIASQFLQTRVFGPLLNAWLPGVLSGLPVFHSGGLILGGAGAMVMHNGGMIPGLAHDERLIIGQVGERVLSRRQNDRFEELLERQAEPQEVIHYYHINAVDAKSFADLVARNPDAIKAVTIQDIGSNGPIRKAIQAVSRGG